MIDGYNTEVMMMMMMMMNFILVSMYFNANWGHDIKIK